MAEITFEDINGSSGGVSNGEITSDAITVTSRPLTIHFFPSDGKTLKRAKMEILVSTYNDGSNDIYALAEVIPTGPRLINFYCEDDAKIKIKLYDLEEDSDQACCVTIGGGNTSS